LKPPKHCFGTSTLRFAHRKKSKKGARWATIEIRELASKQATTEALLRNINAQICPQEKNQKRVLDGQQLKSWNWHRNKLQPKHCFGTSTLRFAHRKKSKKGTRWATIEIRELASKQATTEALLRNINAQIYKMDRS